jgi:hypothetical protein
MALHTIGLNTVNSPTTPCHAKGGPTYKVHGTYTKFQDLQRHAPCIQNRVFITQGLHDMFLKITLQTTAISFR